MPTKTYKPIVTATLSSNAASYTFSSIPDSYTDLILIVNGQVSSAVTIACQVNGDTGSNYSCTEAYSDGTNNGSARSSNNAQISVASIVAQIGSGSQWLSTLHFQNYSNSTTFKTVISRTSATATIVNGTTGLWRSTSAINSIKLFGYAGASGFTAGTTFTLYGIL